MTASPFNFEFAASSALPGRCILPGFVVPRHSATEWLILRRWRSGTTPRRQRSASHTRSSRNVEQDRQKVNVLALRVQVSFRLFAHAAFTAGSKTGCSFVLPLVLASLFESALHTCPSKNSIATNLSTGTTSSVPRHSPGRAPTWIAEE